MRFHTIFVCLVEIVNKTSFTTVQLHEGEIFIKTRYNCNDGGIYHSSYVKLSGHWTLKLFRTNLLFCVFSCRIGRIFIHVNQWCVQNLCICVKIIPSKQETTPSMNQTTRAAATMFDFFPRKKEESITACIDFLSFPNNCYTYFTNVFFCFLN